jgi:hypothetical protein
LPPSGYYRYGAGCAEQPVVRHPHLSSDTEIWESTSILVEEARDGSSYDIRPISDTDAQDIMTRTRAKYQA